MKPLACSALLLVLYECINYTVGDQLINSINGIVGAENYTYYKIQQSGFLHVVLDSVQGDADLYVSSQTRTPTFEQYELQSSTCGEDIVDITPTMKRPVIVGVYGHWVYENTKYILHVLAVTDYDTGYPVDEGSSDHKSTSQRKTSQQQNQRSFGATKDEEESVLWNILVGILKILFDVLM